jgi:uncharacterized membrane protein YhaH (DUF805 family)
MNAVNQDVRRLSVLGYWWRGRISRSQFWKDFALWMCLYTFIRLLNENLKEIGLLALLLLVSIAAVRRAHDRGRSGWFVLLWFVPVPICQLWVLVELGFRRGTIGDNQFGSEPGAMSSKPVLVPQ